MYYTELSIIFVFDRSAVSLSNLKIILI